MDPGKTKPLTVALIAVSVISLATNLILLGKLHRTGKKAAKLEKAYERLMQQYLILEKQKDTGLQSQGDKQKISIKKTQKPKPADGAGRSKPSANLPTEQQKSSIDAPEQPNDSFREEIQDMLAEALEMEFPDLELNETELAELTDTVITIRDSMETMRAMERTAENVEVLEETRERRDQAMLDFERITGMNALEFMLRAPAEGGIDHD